MNINIKATNTTVTDADRDFVDDKLQQLGKFLEDADKVFVEIEVDKKRKDGLRYRVEVSINPPKYYAEGRGNDFYEAMDLVMPKIKEQLKKQKDRKVSARRKKKSPKEL